MFYFTTILVMLIFVMAVVYGLQLVEEFDESEKILSNQSVNMGAFYMLISGENPYGDDATDSMLNT